MYCVAKGWVKTPAAGFLGVLSIDEEEDEEGGCCLEVVG